MVTTRADEAGTSLAARIDRFADAIGAVVGEGDPRWRRALSEVPRHLFIPPTGWAHVNGGPSRAIDRDADPADWWEAVYSNAAITTQADDGATDPPTCAGCRSGGRNSDGSA